MRRVLVGVQFFHEDKLSGFRRPAGFMEGNGEWRFLVPSHRIDGKWAGGKGVWRSVEPVPVAAGRRGRGLWRAWFRYAGAYRWCLRSAEPPVNVLYLVVPPAWWAVPAAMFARRLRIPVVLDLGDPAGAVSSGLAKPVNVLAEAMLRRISTETVVSSPDLSTEDGNVAVTGAGDEFFQVGRRRLAGSDWSRRPPRVIYAGTFDELRSLMRILEVWGELLERVPKLELTLAGRGVRADEEAGLRGSASQLGVAESVRFAGWLDPSDVPSALAAADWGLVSLDARSDVGYAVPTKLVEYFAAALPVLAVGGERVRRILEESGGGVWISPTELSTAGGIDRVAEVLSRDRRTYAEKAHAYAGAHFTRKGYQQAVNGVLRRCALPWSREIERGLAWLERAALVGEGRLRRGRLGLRLATTPAHIPRADGWVYLEISAYAAMLYLALHRLRPREEYAARAEALGRCLLDAQTESGALPFVYDLDRGEHAGPCYAFDTGMAARAWLALDRVSPNAVWREAALRAGRWLAEGMQREDGSFRAAEELGGGAAPELAPPCYYGTGGCLHLKLALVLGDLARAFPETRSFSVGRRKLMDWGLALQASDGSFPVGRGTWEVNGHTHAYALEGLLGMERARGSQLRGLRWSWAHLSPTGWMPERATPGGRGRSVTDATAQVLRLCALEARPGGRGEADVARAAAGMARRLRKAQAGDGGWPAWPDGERRAGPPVWPTLFAVSALLFWEREDLEWEWVF